MIKIEVDARQVDEVFSEIKKDLKARGGALDEAAEKIKKDAGKRLEALDGLKHRRYSKHVDHEKGNDSLTFYASASSRSPLEQIRNKQVSSPPRVKISDRQYVRMDRPPGAKPLEKRFFLQKINGRLQLCRRQEEGFEVRRFPSVAKFYDRKKIAEQDGRSAARRFFEEMLERARSKSDF